jgi:hypothetical protein
MLNRALVERVGVVPEAAGFHDWWVAMVAHAVGEAVIIEKPTILYRRHGRNQTEISRPKKGLARAIGHPLEARKKIASLIEDAEARVAEFLKVHGGHLTPFQKTTAEALIGLRRSGPLARRVSILRRRLFFSSKIRNAGLIALI